MGTASYLEFSGGSIGGDTGSGMDAVVLAEGARLALRFTNNVILHRVDDSIGHGNTNGMLFNTAIDGGNADSIVMLDKYYLDYNIAHWPASYAGARVEGNTWYAPDCDNMARSANYSRQGDTCIDSDNGDVYTCLHSTLDTSNACRSGSGDWQLTGTEAQTGTGNFVRAISPTFTGVPILPTPFTLGGTSMTSDAAELNLLDGYTGIEGTATTLIAGTAGATECATFDASGNLIGSGAACGGSVHDGTITWIGSAAIESGGAFAFGDGTDASVVITGDVTGTDASMTFNDNGIAFSKTLSVVGQVIADGLTVGQNELLTLAVGGKNLKYDGTSYVFASDPVEMASADIGGATNFTDFDTSGIITFAGTAGIETNATVALPATAWTLETAGSPPTEAQFAATNFPTDVLDFGAASDNEAFLSLEIPSDFSTAVTNVTFDVEWFAAATSGDVCFCVSATGVNVGESVDPTPATDACAQVTAQGTTNALNTSQVTFASSGFSGDEMMQLRLTRDVDGGGTGCTGDTMTGNARLTTVKVNYGVKKQ
jgi:hypothetical protein